MKRHTIAVSAALALGAAIAPFAVAQGGSIPAVSSTGATTVQQPVRASALNNAKANSYAYLSNGGGSVSLSALRQQGPYTTGRTITITPPDTLRIVNCFATISGGDLGSNVIRSTSVTGTRCTVRIAYPGEQGKPGKVYFRLVMAFSPPPA
jgi:hypothetical protein